MFADHPHSRLHPGLLIVRALAKRRPDPLKKSHTDTRINRPAY
jgi:hypothetical protein